MYYVIGHPSQRLTTLPRVLDPNCLLMLTGEFAEEALVCIGQVVIPADGGVARGTGLWTPTGRTTSLHKTTRSKGTVRLFTGLVWKI